MGGEDVAGDNKECKADEAGETEDGTAGDEVEEGNEDGKGDDGGDDVIREGIEGREDDGGECSGTEDA